MKLIFNSTNSAKVTLPKKEITKLGWTDKTEIEIKRVGKRIIIEEVKDDL